MVLLRTPEAGQKQGLASVDDVTAIELRADMHRQLALRSPWKVYGVSGAASAKLQPLPTNTFTFPPVHGLDGVHRVQAVLAWRVDAADFGEPVQECLAGAVIAPAGAVVLDVAVPTSPCGTRGGALIRILVGLAEVGASQDVRGADQ